MLARAQRFADRRNVENPELCPVSPFRRVTPASPPDQRALALAALAARAGKHGPGQRFPAFWGASYDWTPDQDHGGVLVRSLQQVPLQADGDVLHLLPAWPPDRDAGFRLHAPGRTVLTGTVRDGELIQLDVQPPERPDDVIVHGTQDQRDQPGSIIMIRADMGAIVKR